MMGDFAIEPEFSSRMEGSVGRSFVHSFGRFSSTACMGKIEALMMNNGKEWIEAEAGIGRRNNKRRLYGGAKLLRFYISA